MYPEKRRKMLDGFLDVAQTQGTKDQQRDMAYLVASYSRYHGELDDIQNGVRASDDHPHHPVADLRSSIARHLRLMRQVSREITTGIPNPKRNRNPQS